MVEVVWGTLLTTTCEVLSVFILIFWVAIWCLHLLAIVHGCHRLHRRGPVQHTLSPDAAEKADGVPGVTILKPLVGRPMDPNLMTNLESFFNLDYPKYEVHFCVADEGDPCIMVVKQLMSKYPAIEATLHVGASNVGVNPKINNIYNGYLQSRYPIIMISDAGIIMRPEALAEMISLMKPGIGIVHQVPYTTDRKGWPATLEKVTFGCSQARYYLFLNMLETIHIHANCLTGMSFIMRKSLIETAGGVSSFGQYLAEDFFLARHCQQSGMGMRISSYPAMQNHGVYSVKRVFMRAVRWTKLRVKMAPASIVLEPLTECVVLGVLASLAASVHLKADVLAFFLFHLLAWTFADWTLINIMQNGPPPFSKFEFVVTWLFREFSALFVFLSTFRDTEIQWRTAKFIVHWGGITELVHTPNMAHVAAPAGVSVV